MMRMEFIRCSFTHCVGVYFHVTGRQLLLVARFFFSEEGVCHSCSGLRTPAQRVLRQSSLLPVEGQQREGGF